MYIKLRTSALKFRLASVMQILTNIIPKTYYLLFLLPPLVFLLSPLPASCPPL